MKFVRPKVYLIAQTQLCHSAIDSWLDGHGTNYASIEKTLPFEDGSRLVALAGKRCYLSFEANGANPNVTKTRTEAAKYIENILETGHGSVTEHATYSFAIENISRVCTGELNRHRVGVQVSEGSMRYIRFDDIAVVETEMMRKHKWLRDFIQMIFEFTEKHYKTVCDREFPGIADFGTKKILTSCLRRVIGMGVATGGVWTFNIRALRFIIKQRTDIAAEEEIREVFDQIAEIMKEREPLLFQDFDRADDGSWKPKYHKI